MHPNETLLNDYVEETLAAAERSDVDRHLGDCDACRALVEDLRAIRAASASLDHRDPPGRAWSRLERAIRLEQEHREDLARTIHKGDVARAPQPSDGSSAWLKPSRYTYTWLAAAAAIVIAIYAGVRYRPNPAPAPAPVTVRADDSGTSAQASVEAELRAAEEHYDKAIRGLEQITNAEKGALDTQTAATLQKNLAVIDQAISESRAALRAQPASQPAQDSLLESFKAKLGLLQDTVALINEMRKGNEAGAARIGSGLTKKG